MGRKYNSKIRNISKKELEIIVKESKTAVEVLRKLGYKERSFGCNKTLYKRLNEDNIDFSHLPTGRSAWHKLMDIKSVLTLNSTYNPNNLKRELIKNGMLKNKCYECGQEPMWNNKPLTLQIDHIDGNKTNQTIENLRILCPNCHTQTKTFAGANKKKKNNNSP